MRSLNVAKRLGLVGLALLACVAAGQANTEKTVSDGRVQQFPAVHYIYASVETKMADGQLAKDAHEVAHKFNELLKDGKLRPAGAPIFTFVGNTGELTKAFTMTYGAPVAPGTAVPEGYKETDLPAMKAFTVLYSGKTAGIGEAYVQAYTQIQQAGLMPDGTSRQMMLYWESEESTNNVFMLQVGVK